METQNPYTSPKYSDDEAGQLTSERKTCRYAVSKEIQLASASQFFFTVLIGWRWICAVVIVLCGIFLLAIEEFVIIGVIFLTVATAFTLMWIKSYVATQRIALAQLALPDSEEVILKLEDHGLHVTCGESVRTVKWSKVNRVRDSKDFVFLLHDKIPLATVPKKVFSSEIETFLHSLDNSKREAT